MFKLTPGDIVRFKVNKTYIDGVVLDVGKNIIQKSYFVLLNNVLLKKVPVYKTTYPFKSAEEKRITKTNLFLKKGAILHFEDLFYSTDFEFCHFKYLLHEKTTYKFDVRNIVNFISPDVGVNNYGLSKEYYERKTNENKYINFF